MMDEKRDANVSPIGRLSIVEETVLGVAAQDIPKLVPGLLLAGATTAAATWLTDSVSKSVLGLGKSPVSAIMTAILIGLAVRNLLGMAEVFRPGIDFCVRKVLRLGIILMGIRLSVLELVKIGIVGLPIVLACITAGLALTIYLARLLGLPRRLGTLIAVGTSICGASAIVATAPGIEASDEEIAYAIATITIFGIVAMLLYPHVAHLLFSGDQVMAGLLLGTSIHETAQVTGAGLIYDSQFHPARPTAADVAICAKLVRNALMAIVIPSMILLHRRGGPPTETSGGSSIKVARLFPMFIIGFILLAVLRSAGDAGVHATGLAFSVWSADRWGALHQGVAQLAGHLLAIAMAGVGLSASYRRMRALGARPFSVGFLAAVLVGVVGVVVVSVIRPSTIF